MLTPVVSLSWRKEAGSLQRRALPWGLQLGSSGAPVLGGPVAFIIPLVIAQSSVGLLMVIPQSPGDPDECLGPGSSGAPC